MAIPEFNRVNDRVTVDNSNGIDRKNRVLLINLTGIWGGVTGTSEIRGDRNPAFTDPIKVQRIVDEYFTACEQSHLPYTMTGLSLELGITNGSLARYARGLYDSDIDRDIGWETYGVEFSRIIRKARQRVEHYAETRLYDKNGQNGARFVLDCGFGWKTQREAMEIIEKQKLIEIRERELELKERLADIDKDGIGGIEFVLKRKGIED